VHHHIQDPLCSLLPAQPISRSRNLNFKTVTEKKYSNMLERLVGKPNSNRGSCQIGHLATCKATPNIAKAWVHRITAPSEIIKCIVHIMHQELVSIPSISRLLLYPAQFSNFFGCLPTQFKLLASTSFCKSLSSCACL
jgi:hypothetical protein